MLFILLIIVGASWMY
ncbi:YjcZ family sporulation protein [Neobacillus pocheonensis]